MNSLKTSSGRLVPLAFVATLLQVNSLAAAEFRMKSVDYDGDTAAIFVLTSKIPANESAEVKIKFQGPDHDKRADQVIRSLRSSLPATVKRETSGTPPPATTITVTVATQAADDVDVSYSRSVTDPPTFHYNLDLSIVRSNDKPDNLSSEQPDNRSAMMNGFVTVRDESSSNAKWSDTQVTIRRERGDVQLQKITIPHNPTADSTVQDFSVVPLPGVVDYAVRAAKSPYLKAGAGTKIYEIYTLSAINKVGESVLLPSSNDVRIFQDREFRDGRLDGGQFVALGRLKHDVKLDTSVDIVTEQVSWLTITRSEEEQCYEALSLANGKLTFQLWSVVKRELANGSDANVNVLLQGETKPVPVPAKDKVKLPDQLGKKGKEDELILYASGKDEEFAKKLGQLQVFSVDAPQEKVAPIAAVFTKIVELDGELTTLEAEKTATDESLRRLREAGPPSTSPGATPEPEPPADDSRLWQRILDHLETRSQTLQTQIGEKRSDQHNQRWSLLRLLFPEIPAQ